MAIPEAFDADETNKNTQEDSGQHRHGCSAGDKAI